ncbi:hypothetical protein DMA11_04135 [Marinilabiliaceae bacterium JC017]|nr:hypothetical protein DMA11_04135 [Marinilabiliaceae bacterium JC017]
MQFLLCLANIVDLGRYRDKHNKKTIYYKLALDESLTLKGNIDYTKFDYAGFYFREYYQDFASEEDYLEEFEENHTGVMVKDFNLTNLDSIEKPIQESYNLEIKNKVEKVNDLVFVNPFLFEQIEENPFKMEERKYPVDFAYNRNRYLISQISLPANFVVEEIPAPIVMRLPDKSASVRIQHQVSHNTLTTIYKFNIDKPVFMPDEYSFLKQLYAQIIKKQAEPVIFKINTDAASL